VKYFRVVRRLNDGRAMLNVGCGARAHPEWENVDFSPYARLARRKWLARILRGVGLLSRERSRNVLGVPSTIRRWDVRRGLPFDEDVFDVAYHSHFLTHVDKEQAPPVLRECWRVLKRGGTIRVVVPDLERIVHRYNDAVAAHERGEIEAPRRHEEAVDELFELIGVERVARKYDRKDALCCGLPLMFRDMARGEEIQAKNLDDAKGAGATAMTFLCPVCVRGLGSGAVERGMDIYMLSDLCRLALQEEIPEYTA